VKLEIFVQLKPIQALVVGTVGVVGAIDDSVVIAVVTKLLSSALIRDSRP